MTDGCNGGIMSDAFRWVQQNGIMSNFNYPYIAFRNKTCLYVKSKSVTSCRGFVKIPQGSESELKKVVATIGPVAIGIQATFQSIQFYSTGIYFEPNCNPLQIDHAVLAVGYGSENGSDYWIIKNSWGTHWGGEWFKIN